MGSIISPIRRISFSKIRKVMEKPNFLEVQLNSFNEAIKEDSKQPSGLRQLFEEVFPITDFNEIAVLEYVDYYIDS
ncbi:MAG: hypothetical protein SVN78_09550, partial [Deferribacterota bacterium]|nr:hypothetical protein [Deferribacterota bacterium]